MPNNNAMYGAILRGGYQPAPYLRPEAYGDPRGSYSLGDLIGRRGQLEAQGHLAGSDMLAQGIQQAGQAIGGYFQQREEKKELAKRDAATLAAIESWDGQDPMQLYKGLATVRGPGREAMEYTNAVLALKGGRKKDPKQELQSLGEMGAFLRDQPDEVIERAIPALQQRYGGTFADMGVPMDAAADPAHRRKFIEKVAEVWGPKQQSKKTVVGGVIYDEDSGQFIVPPKEPKTHEVTVPGPGGTKVKKLVTEEELAQGITEYVAPRDPKEAKEPERMWVLRNGEAVRVAEGEVRPGDQPYSARNTTEKDTSTGKVVGVLDSIDELSKRINTGSGPGARLAGVIRGRSAGLNLDPDVQEYESLVSGFTPMVARAVGHSGVLTQQDVDSVRKLFPSPGDSAELRDRKMAQLRRLLANEGGTATAGGAPGGTKASPIKDGVAVKGERRRINGQLAEWDGRGWVAVR